MKHEKGRYTDKIRRLKKEMKQNINIIDQSKEELKDRDIELKTIS